MVSGPTFAIVLLTGGVIYTFGYLRAVMHRANRDYKTVKANLPVLRKGFWAAWWAAVKIGTGVAIIGLVLIAWVVHDVRQGAR